ncbi:MAG: hypothetical protein PVI86_18820 [Phycisphaerae bacterium]|jgi:hypothetical protein
MHNRASVPLVISSLSGVLCTAAVVPAQAEVIHVPAQYATIQEGIDAAVDGDVVEVADGTYAGTGNKDLDFGGATRGDPITKNGSPHYGFTLVLDVPEEAAGTYTIDIDNVPDGVDLDSYLYSPQTGVRPFKYTKPVRITACRSPFRVRAVPR